MSAPQPRPVGARRYLMAAGALAVVNQLGVMLTAPLLESAPLLLVAMSPLGRNLLLVTPSVGYLPFVLVAAGRRALGSLVGHQIGLAYGRRGIAELERRSPRMGRWARTFERLFGRAGKVASFLVPRGSALLAGAADMPTGRYMALSTAGHIFWVSVTYQIGDYLRDYITPVVAYMRAHVLQVTLAFALLVGAQILYRRLRARRRPAAPPQRQQPQRQ